jgi:hypothetical protein
MSFVRNGLRQANAALDRFLFASCEPAVCSVLRILVGLLLCIYTYVWWLDGAYWFSDSGVLRATTASRQLNGEFKSLLIFLPQSPEMVRGGLMLLGVQSVLMLLGVGSRFQAACIFVLLTSFQHRNVLIVDGQDIVIRWFVFMMIFMPLDHRWSLLNWMRGIKSTATSASAWALRLFQVEMTAIYFSSAFMKVAGETWRDGTALYYVARADDAFGRFYLPDWLFETVWIVKLCTWTVLAVEIFLPLGLWLPRLRPVAVVLAIGLHLAIEYSMNLFLFQWIMLAGLVSFVNIRSQETT